MFLLTNKVKGPAGLKYLDEIKILLITIDKHIKCSLNAKIKDTRKTSSNSH